MKVLITGGAGFIGSHLAESLLSRGDEVKILDDLSTGNFNNISHLMKHEKFRCVIEDVRNMATTEELVKECDVVFHLAAAVGVKLVMEQPTQTIETNIFGTEAVLKMCSRYHKKVLITSTSEVYGKGMSERFKEDDDCIIGPPNKRRWSYAASKSVEEFLTFAYWHEKQLPIVVVRLFNTVGPRQSDRYGMVIPNFVKQAMSNKPISVYGDGKQTRSFLSVYDVVWALIALMENPQACGEVFNIGGDREISIESLAELVIQLTGSTSTIEHIAYFDAYGEHFEDMRRRVPDTTKLRALTGFEPKVPLEEIIRRIVEWYRPVVDARQSERQVTYA